MMKIKPKKAAISPTAKKVRGIPYDLVRAADTFIHMKTGMVKGTVAPCAIPRFNCHLCIKPLRFYFLERPTSFGSIQGRHFSAGTTQAGP